MDALKHEASWSQGGCHSTRHSIFPAVTGKREGNVSQGHSFSQIASLHWIAKAPGKVSMKLSAWLLGIMTAQCSGLGTCWNHPEASMLTGGEMNAFY